MTDGATEPMSPPETRPRWTGWQWYVVALLLGVNFVSGMDRQVIAILMQPMKTDLKLSDAQLGLISGPAFALFYAVSAIPIARLAERFNRARILAALMVFWSSATALCGTAVNLASIGLCRVGVGLGEGGAHPIAQSVIADNFDHRQRGGAMSIYASGPPIASILAPLIAGLAAQVWGWRVAFAVIGVPGLLVALLVALTLKERRKVASSERPAPNFRRDFSALARNPTFVFIFIAGAFNGVAITGTTAFVPAFVMRTQGFKLSEVGGVVALLGVLGLAGALLGGYLGDRFADRRGRSYLYVCAAGAVLSLLFFLLAFTQSSWPLILAGLLGANLATDLKSGANYAAIQNAVPSTLRATAPAVFTIAANVIGAGLGALIVGALSDAATAHIFGTSYPAYEATCSAPLGAVAAACKAASAQGLRTSLSFVTLAFAGAALCFVLAARTSKIDHN